MIANPQLADRFYRYDPYSASLTHERYAYQEMYAMRREAIEQARLPSSRTFGVVFGTLGRQGSPAVLGWLQRRLEQRGKRCVVVLLSELTREKLERFERTVDIWIQTSCPRLSIDWGYSFGRPLLTPYEAMIALMDDTEWLHAKPQWMADSVASNNCTDCKCPPSADANYPMDFYAKYSLGPWTPNHVDMEAEERERILRRQKRQSIKLPK
jgi:2-(3-amino-3-carboxypropyl)histidine synthase